MTNEAFSRVKIDAQLRALGWEIDNFNIVRFEVMLADGTRVDYVLCDRYGRALAVIEAKKAAINLVEAEEQAKAYARQLNVSYIFLANGTDVLFWEWETEAFPRVVKTFFSQGDLERRYATRQVRRDVAGVAIDHRIAGRDYGYKVKTIKTLSGSRIAVLGKFRYKLREALALLVEVGFIVSYDIDSRTDILKVVRAPRRIALTDVIEGKCTKH